MNNAKSLKTLYLIGIVSLIVVLMLGLTLNTLYNNEVSVEAKAETIAATVESKFGSIYNEEGSAYHKSSEQLTAEYGSSYVEINSYATLSSFLNASNSVGTVGVLVNNIDFVLASESSAQFAGTLDGNGYKITITATGITMTNYFQYNYFKGDVDYCYAGMLVGVNRGRIKNLKIDWNGSLNVNATNSNGGVIKTPNTNRPFVTGIVCGLNAEGAVIDNLELNINGAFAVGKGSDSGETDVRGQSAIAGGVCGALYKGTISHCTVNNNGGVLSVADGSTSGLGCKSGSSAAGGFVGTIYPSSDSKLKTCILTGNGPVRAISYNDTKNRNNDGFWGFAGGAVGASLTVVMNGTVNDVKGVQVYLLQDRQIDGLISSWTGYTEHYWKNQDTKDRDDFNQVDFAQWGNQSGASVWASTHQGALFGIVDPTASASDSYSSLLDVIVTYEFNAVVGAQDDTGGKYIDNNSHVTTGAWNEVYSLNNGGSVKVGYDKNSKPRIIASADDYDLEDVDSQTTDKLYDKVSSGKIIWSSNFMYYADVKDDEGNVIGQEKKYYENLIPTQEVPAEVRYFASGEGHVYEYTFGEIVDVSFVNTNTTDNVSLALTEYSKLFDKGLFHMPSTIIKDSDNQVVDNAHATLETLYFVRGREAAIDLSAHENIASLLYLPGDYEFACKQIVNNQRFAYYDETNHYIANYNEDLHKFYYSVLEDNGTLLNVSSESTSLHWKTDVDTITFNYGNKANIIDYYTVTKGSNANPYIKKNMPTDSVSESIVISESGNFFYTVGAYIVNPLLDTKYFTQQEIDSGIYNYLQIGKSSVQVFVDNKGPEITNIKYYEYDEDNEEDFYKGEEIKIFNKDEWQDTDIVITYDVVEKWNTINIGSGHAKVDDSNDKKWQCSLILTEKNPVATVKYSDTWDNVTTYVFESKIDTTNMDLNDVQVLNEKEYLRYEGPMDYSPVALIISFTPVFGASGAHLYYSHEEVDGESIWVESEQELKSNQPNKFIVDYELINQPIRLKLVNDNGIHSEILAKNGEYSDGYIRHQADDIDEDVKEAKAKAWNIRVVVAAMGITYDNIFYKNANEEEFTYDAAHSLKTLLSTEEGKATFKEWVDRAYDGTNKAYVDLRAKVYTSGTTLMSNTILYYSQFYQYSEPAIEESMLDVQLTFDSKDAGTRNLFIKVSGKDEYLSRYEFRFLESGQHPEEYAELIGEEYANQENKQMDGEYAISKYELTGYLDAAFGAGDLSYVFGQDILTQIIVAGVGDDEIILDLTSSAVKTHDEEKDIDIYPSAGSYSLSDAVISDDNGDNKASFMNNYEIIAETKPFEIKAKNVIVNALLDGKDTYATTILFDGKNHYIGGTYVDIYGDYQNIKVTYYKYNAQNDSWIEAEEELDGGVKQAGRYKAILSSSDPNYAVANTGKEIKFIIQYGALPFDQSEQIKTFNGEAQAFDIITDIDLATYEAPMVIDYYRLNSEGIPGTEKVTPFEVGRYLVLIEVSGSDYFYSQKYDNMYLTIQKADTELTVTQEIPVVYDGNAHTFSLEELDLVVKADNGNTQVIVVKDGEDGSKYIEYTTFDGSEKVTKPYSEVIEITTVVNRKKIVLTEANWNEYAQFIAAGEHEYTIRFKGDSCYASTETVYNFEIQLAKFDGIEFNDAKFYFTTKDTYHSIYIEDNEAFLNYLDMGAVVTYSYTGEEYKDANDHVVNAETEFEYRKDTDKETNEIKFSEFGEYSIMATITLDNYITESYTAILTIDKTALPKLEPVAMGEIAYDGMIHPGEFKFVDENITIKPTYVKGQEAARLIDYFMMILDKEHPEDAVRVDVSYSKDARPVNAGTYNGIITLSSANYADTDVKVRIVIKEYEAVVSFDSIRSIIASIDDSTDLSKLHPTFEFMGETYSANYEYYDANGHKVNLNSDGTLDAGTYTVKVSFDNGNFTTSQTATLNIEESGNKGGGPGEGGGSFMEIFKKYMLWFIIGGVVIVLGVVGGIVGGVMSKKKKGERRKPTNGKKPKGSGGGKAKKEEPRKQAPVKKQKVESPQDKAQF